MSIRTEKHCRLVPAPSDGTRILVMRRWPRGVRKDRFHAWDRHLGPSEALLNSFLGLLDALPEGSEVGPGNPAWEELMARYVEEMQDQRDSIQDLSAHSSADLSSDQGLAAPGTDDRRTTWCERHMEETAKRVCLTC